MYIVFWITSLIFLILLPCVILSVAMWILSKKFNFSFHVLGPLRYRDIIFQLENEYFYFMIKLDYFSISLIWLKFRFIFRGLFFDIKLKSEILKRKFIEKRRYKFESRQSGPNESKNFKNDENKFENNDYFQTQKNFFYEKIRSRFIKKHENQDKKTLLEEDLIETVIRPNESSRNDKLIRNILILVDFLIEEIEINIKFTDTDNIYSLNLKKILIGALKGINKNKEIHFISILNEIHCDEYVQINSDDCFYYNKISFLNINKFFVNLKLEYGLFPKDYYTLLNTVNIKSELHKSRINFSSRSLNSLFSFIRKITKFIENARKINDEKEPIKDDFSKKKFEENYSLLKNSSKINLEERNEELIYLIRPNKNKSENICNTKETKNEKIVSFEELILNKIDKCIKKIKLKIFELELNILSDNHNFSFVTANFSNLIYESKNVFNYYFNKSKVKLLKQMKEIKMQEFSITGRNNTKNILFLETFAFNITEEIIYNQDSKNGNIITHTILELPNLDVKISMIELEKIIDIISVICKGIEKIEEKEKKNTKNFVTEIKNFIVEKHSCENYTSVKIENVDFILEDDNILIQFYNFSFILKIDEKIFLESRLELIIDPINIGIFDKEHGFYNGNLVNKNLRIFIENDFISNFSKIEFIIDKGYLFLHDEMILKFIKFTGYLMYVLSKFNRKKLKEKELNIEFNKDKKTKEEVKFNFSNIALMINFDFYDLYSVNIPSIVIKLEENLVIEQMNICFRNLLKFDNKFKEKLIFFQNIINLKRLEIKFGKTSSYFDKDAANKYYNFNMCKNERNFFVDVLTNEIFLNELEMNLSVNELIFSILKISNFSQFIPIWAENNLNKKYLSRDINENYKSGNVTNLRIEENFEFFNIDFKRKQKSVNKIMFDKLKIKINLFNNKDKEKLDDYLLDLCGLQINLTNFEENHSNKSGKDMKHQNILMEQYKKIEINNYLQGNVNDYFVDFDSTIYEIKKNSEVEINLSKIDIYSFNNIFVTAQDISIRLEEESEVNKLNSSKNLSETVVFFHDNFVIINDAGGKFNNYSKICVTNENFYFILQKPKLIDIFNKHLDKFNSLIVDKNKNCSEYLILSMGLNNKIINSRSLIECKLKNLNFTLNSYDSLDKIYNKLKINFQFILLEKYKKEGNFKNIDDNLQKDYHLNTLKLSIYKSSIGFEYSSNYDYPLLSIPFSELSLDESKNHFRINIPNSSNIIYKYKINNFLNLKSFSNEKLIGLTNTQELDMFIIDTNTITLFFNFQYINTFHIIIQSLIRDSYFIKQTIVNSVIKNKHNLTITGMEERKKEIRIADDQNYEKVYFISPKPIISSNENLTAGLIKRFEINQEFNCTNFKKIEESTQQVNKNLDLIEIDGPKEQPLNNCFELNLEDEVEQTNLKNLDKPIQLNYAKKITFEEENNNNLDQFDELTKQELKLTLTVFDFKIIYLVDYKNEYSKIFRFNQDIVDKGYFGYILRFYQIYLSYHLKNNIDSMSLDTNFMTVSFLNKKNFRDEKFFINDKDIKHYKFRNLKINKTFRKFHDLNENEADNNEKEIVEKYSKINTHNLLNKNIFEITESNNLKLFFELNNFSVDKNLNFFFMLENKKNYQNDNISPKTNEIKIDNVKDNLKNNYKTTSVNLEELIFDHKHTFLKIFSISFKRDIKSQQKSEDIYFLINDIKVTWNKFNMDIFEIIIFDDIFQILDKVILKFDANEEIENNQKELIETDESESDQDEIMKIFKKNNDENMLINEKNNQLYPNIDNKSIGFINYDINSKLKKVELNNFFSRSTINRNHNKHEISLIANKENLNLDPDINTNSTKNIPKQNNEINLISNLDIGRFNFVFDIINPQICIQNEIKKSKILLSTRNRFHMKISKICLNDDKKDMKVDLNINMMTFYISPNYMDSKHICWIGNSEENKFYLEENLFIEIFKMPILNFVITENIRKISEENKFELFTKMEININDILGNFNNKTFIHFQNIFEVFIFNRGYSYADEKINIDSRENDLKIFETDEIKKEISKSLTPFISMNKIKQKEINLNFENTNIILNKEGKEIIKIYISNFEGEHVIYSDKATETKINIKDMKIIDLCNINKEIILCSNYKKENLTSEFEDKLDLITLRRRDSFQSIGTDSNWYVLDYFELNILPLIINISKYHCDFIMEFLFNDKIIEEEDEQHDILLNRSKTEIEEKKRLKEKKEKENKKKKEKEIQDKGNPVEKEYPIFFKHVRINETALNLSMFFYEKSKFNLKNAKLKFTSFEKKEKFYEFSKIMMRLIRHLKFVSIKNVPSVLSNLLFGSAEKDNNKSKENNEKDTMKKNVDTETNHRNILFGKK